MQEDIIDSYVDRTGIEGDTEFMLKQLNQVLAAIKTINASKVKVSDGGSFKEVTQASKEYSKASIAIAEAQKAVVKTIRDRMATEAQLKTVQTDYNKQTAANRLELQKQNKEIKTAIELRDAESGSIEKARARVKALTLERNKLNLFTEEGQQKLKKLNAEIDQNNDFIKKNVDALAQQKINVGNYQGSAKIIVEALGSVEKKLETLREKQVSLNKEAERNQIGFKRRGGEDELSKVNAQLAQTEQQYQALTQVTSQPTFLKLAGQAGDARKEIRGFTTTLVQLEQQGLGATEFANELRQRLAKLTDEVGDTRAEIKALSSDSRTFDLFAGSVNFAADAFQTAAGAAVLFGASEEDAAEATRTLIAVQSISNGVKGIANELTTKGTFANLAYTYVQTQYAIVTNASTAATARFAAAMKLLLPIAIIGGIILLVAKLKEWSVASGEAARQSKLLSDVSKEVAKSAGEEIAKLDSLYKVATNTNLAIKDRKKAVDELQEQYPEHFKNIKEEVILQGKAADAYNATKAAILETAKTRAIEAKLADLSSKELDKIYEREETARKQRENDLAKRKADIKDSRSAEERGLDQFNTIAKGTELTKQLGDINKDLEQLAKDKEFLLNQINTPNVKSGGDAGKDKDKKDNTAKTEAEARLKAIIDGYKTAKEAELSALNEMAEDEKNTLVQRTFAYTQFIRVKQQLIRDLAEFEKNTGKKTDEEKKAIDAKAASEQIDVIRETQKKIIEITDDFKDKTKKGSLPIVDVAEASNSLKVIGKALDEYYEKQKQIKDKEKELYEERKAAARDFVDTLKGAFAEAFTFSLDAQRAENDEQLKLIEERKNKDIEAANQTIQNKEEREAAIKKIEVRAQVDKEKIEKKNRQIESKKAEIEKFSALLSIAIQTARTVFEIKAKAAALASNPATAFLAPLALAQIPFVVGSAAISAALIAAKPIPKFFKGKNVDDKYEGMAWVDDGGRPEAIIRESGEVEIGGNQPRMTWVGKNDIILPDANMLWQMSRGKSDKALGIASASDDAFNRKDYMYGVKNIVTAIKNQPKPKTPNRHDVLLQAWLSSGKSWKDLNG